MLSTHVKHIILLCIPKGRVRESSEADRVAASTAGALHLGFPEMERFKQRAMEKHAKFANTKSYYDNCDEDWASHREQCLNTDMN